MATPKQAGILLAAAAALGGLVAWGVVRQRQDGDAQSADEVGLDGNPLPPGAGKSRSTGASANDPERQATSAERGQDTVMCRSLLNNWVSALEEGQPERAARLRKAVIAYGPVGRETIEWALKSLQLPESIQATLKDSLNAF